MTQELIIIFFSIFILSITSFYFGISLYFISAAVFIHYYTSDPILAHLSKLSIFSAGLIIIQYFKKEYLNRDFMYLVLWFCGGLVLNKLVSDQIILLNAYKFRINFIFRFSDILAPVVLFTSIILNKNLKYLLVFVMAFTPISGLYYVVYNLYKNKKTEDIDVFIIQILIVISMITNKLYLFTLGNLYTPELKFQNLIAAFGIITGVYVSIRFRNKIPISLYRYMSILLLIILSIGAVAANVFF